MRRSVLALLIGAALTAGCGGDDGFSTTAFDEIRGGDSESVVQDKLGEPDGKTEVPVTGNTVWEYCAGDSAYLVFVDKGRVDQTQETD